jgi:hypothetical protein
MVNKAVEVSKGADVKLTALGKYDVRILKSMESLLWNMRKREIGNQNLRGGDILECIKKIQWTRQLLQGRLNDHSDL